VLESGDQGFLLVVLVEGRPPIKSTELRDIVAAAFQRARAEYLLLIC
jgi:hypothetical protein